MINAREAFEAEYGTFNIMSRKPNGEYSDWNLELTWHCWDRAWKKAVETLKNDGGQRPNWFCRSCGHRFYMGSHGGIGVCPKCEDYRIDRL